MFDHIGIRSNSPAALESFLLRALSPLGITIAMRGPDSVGLGLGGKPSLWIYPAYAPPTPLHLAIAAKSRAHVDMFYAAAIEAGGQDNGRPGLRPSYHPSYYAAFVIAPDGHNVEVVCHMPEA